MNGGWSMDQAYLVLSDGSVFEGNRIGAACDHMGELVFTTGMCSYLETLTNPSFAGQLVVQTFPMIGNYGVIEADFEGRCALHGYIVRECCSDPSNFRSMYDLDTFLKQQGIPGICGVDTRRLTTLIREKGVMNAMICSKIPEDLKELKEYRIVGAVAREGCKVPSVLDAFGEAHYRVALLDCGTKNSIVRELRERGCEVTLMPHTTTAEQILVMAPDGVVISNGPGDPAENTALIAELGKLMGKVPMFGIGLGHQLLALAQGGKTEKLNHGHRGDNQPVRNLATGRTVITSQNHGYTVLADSLKGVAVETYRNANDGTCEGLEYPGKRCFSVQFYPAECGGAQDTQHLFEHFIVLMGGNN